MIAIIEWFTDFGVTESSPTQGSPGGLHAPVRRAVRRHATSFSRNIKNLRDSRRKGYFGCSASSARGELPAKAGWRGPGRIQGERENKGSQPFQFPRFVVKQPFLQTSITWPFISIAE
jgi:hypothetical protein